MNEIEEEYLYQHLPETNHQESWGAEDEAPEGLVSLDNQQNALNNTKELSKTNAN